MLPNPVPILNQKQIHRFWSKIEICGIDQCWRFTGKADDWGYGLFYCCGTKQRSHRVAYALARGPIPSLINVLHCCDHRICCNPVHLFLGTTQDNMTDMVRKDRSTRGERNSTTVLTEREVLEIRALYVPYDPVFNSVMLAARFGVHQATVNAILSRKSWKHI